MLRNTFFLLLGIALLSGCKLEQEIDLNLPYYESQAAVECYLQPGQPIVLSLVRSVGYLDNLKVIYERGATVVIRHNGISDTLSSFAFALPEIDTSAAGNANAFAILRPFVGDSLFFYIGLTPVSEDYSTLYELEVTTRSGEKITASTRILPPVPIDTTEYAPSQQRDSLYYVLTKFTDDGTTANYYRFMIQKGNINSNPDNDFALDDQNLNGQQFILGTNFDYKVGDTVVSTVYHINEDYYRFRSSVDASIQANASPFAQPARIRSNVTGGIGIFTGFTFDRRQTVIQN